MPLGGVDTGSIYLQYILSLCCNISERTTFKAILEALVDVDTCTYQVPARTSFIHKIDKIRGCLEAAGMCMHLPARTLCLFQHTLHLQLKICFTVRYPQMNNIFVLFNSK